MSQVIRQHVAEIAVGSATSDEINVSGLLFGTIQFRRKDGSAVPTGTWQIEVNRVKADEVDDDYFEAAKDSLNETVAAIAFGNTNRIFNVPPETMASRKCRVKLASNLTGDSPLQVVFSCYDNA